MKVVCLEPHPAQYSCSSYLILGEWNRIQDVNTLIDAGVDDFVLNEIAGLSTGIGKKAVEQLILTHGHFDHHAGAKFVKEKYCCKVYGFSPLEIVDEILTDGQTIRCGDQDMEVIHTPGHSNDSICLYCKKQEILFSGDTPLFIKTIGGSYTEEFVKALENISKRKISKVYPGHGLPIMERVGELISDTLRNVYQSQITTI